MTIPFTRAAGAVLFALAVPAAAQDHATAAATMPVYAHIVRFQAPVAYAPAFQKDNGGRFFIFEMVPKGETLQQWTGMMTVTGLNGAAGALPPPAQYLQNFANGYRNACPDTFTLAPVPRAGSRPDGPTLFFLGCGKVTAPGQSPRSEMVLAGFMASPKGLYSVQWAERGPAQEKAPVFDAARWRVRVEALEQARLCERVPGEAAPYPSCK